jgi:hypothetical protein
LVGDRLIGISQQLLGDLPSARRHLEHAHAHYVPPIHRSYIIRFQNDQRGAAGSFLGKILWLQGSLIRRSASSNEAWRMLAQAGTSSHHAMF